MRNVILMIENKRFSQWYFYYRLNNNNNSTILSILNICVDNGLNSSGPLMVT